MFGFLSSKGENLNLGKELLLFIFNETVQKRKWNSVDRLQAVKIIYLLEKEFKRKTGIKLSKYIFIKHRLGPFSNEIVTDLENLKETGIIENTNTYYNYKVVDLKVCIKEIERVEKEIKDNNLEKELNEIIDKAKEISLLLDYVENLEEVKRAKFGEEIKV